MKDLFHRIAGKAAELVGSPWTFIGAVAVILMWAVSGPLFGFSDTWQLVINTGTTIITFLMVFLIQNTQNRDARATHLKLDELIRSTKGARNSMVSLENSSEEELDMLHKSFLELHKQYGSQVERIRDEQTRRSDNKLEKKAKASLLLLILQTRLQYLRDAESAHSLS